MLRRTNGCAALRCSRLPAGSPRTAVQLLGTIVKPMPTDRQDSAGLPLPLQTRLRRLHWSTAACSSTRICRRSPILPRCRRLLQRSRCSAADGYTVISS